MIAGRRAARRGLLALGWAYLGVGLLFYLTILVTTWWLVIGPGGGGPGVRDLEQGFWVVGGSLDVVVLLGLGLLVGGIGGLTLYDARQLRRVRLLFDQRGVSLADHPPVTVPWDGIRHIAVTAGKPGWRRLLVDDGRMSEQWWSAGTIHPGRAQLRLLARRRRFLVNLPIDRLDQDVHLIVSEIHHHSGGRFPDRGARQLAA